MNTSATSLRLSLASGPLVALAWFDRSNNESGFTIERAVNGGAFTTLITLGANVTSYNDSAVTVGNSYSYRVAATNIGGPSTYSNTVSVDVTVPPAPTNLAAIKGVTNLRSDLPQVACFDTAFHRGHPELADRFALPEALYREGVRRYGFHGLSYEYIASTLPRFDQKAAAGRNRRQRGIRRRMISASRRAPRTKGNGVWSIRASTR